MSSMPVQKPYASKQAVGTPDDFLKIVQDRFGEITIDLAAHKANNVAFRYFAPELLINTYIHGKTNHEDIVADFVNAGASWTEVNNALFTAKEDCNAQNLDKIKVSVKNHDTQHIGLNSLNQDWTKAIGDGLGFLNPEYTNIGPWAEKCKIESQKGARILLLVPLTSSNWAMDHVHGHSFVQGLNPRLIFKGHTAPYPKDLMCAYYDISMTSKFECWRWKD